MQYKIPQNVDVEDKIIGPLTLRQFIALLFAGLICFFLYSTIGQASFALFVVSAAPFALAGFAFAFIRINERSMETFMLASASTLTRPRKRIWRQTPTLGPIKEQPIAPVRPEEKAPPSPGEVHSQLEQLSQIVDSRGWEANDEHTEAFMGGGRIVSGPTKAAGWHEAPPDVMDETSQNPIAKLLDDVIPGDQSPKAAPAESDTAQPPKTPQEVA